MRTYKVGIFELVTGRYLFDNLEDLAFAKAIFDEYDEYLDYTVDIYPGVAEETGAYRYVVAVVFSKDSSDFKRVATELDGLFSANINNWWTTVNLEEL